MTEKLSCQPENVTFPNILKKKDNKAIWIRIKEKHESRRGLTIWEGKMTVSIG
jgi:hypothetical protein